MSLPDSAHSQERSGSARPRLCLLYLDPIPALKEDFATIVPVRMKEILGNRADLHVVYAGSLNETILRQCDIKAHRYGGGKQARVFFLLGLTVFCGVIVRREKITLVQNVWSHYWLAPMCLLGRALGVPVVARVAGIPIRAGGHTRRWRVLRNRIGRWIEMVSLRLADHVIALSTSLERELVSRGLDEAKITTLSQGVNTDVFRPIGGDLERAGRRHVVLFVGRVTAQKGIVDLIEAVAGLCKEGLSDITLRVVGGASAEERVVCVDAARRFQVGGAVEFNGFVSHEELPEVYRESSVFVLPSYSEGLPNAMLEAMASGLPCIGTRVGEVPQLLADGRGVVVEPRDPKGLSAAIRGVLEDPARARAMGLASRSFVLGQHSYRSLDRQYRELFLAGPAQWS